MPTENGPWAPFEPTGSDPWDLPQAAHLHPRPRGPGPRPARPQSANRRPPPPAAGAAPRPPARSGDQQQALDSLRRGVLDSRDADRLKAWWLYRVLYDSDPLREKLTLFWHGHFATSNRKVNSVPLMLAQNEALRRHALGPFADLLTSMVGDPAMLVWLDGPGRKKEKPNENFAREFLELFTLGVGHYTEADIRAAARAFTGWAVEDGRGVYQEAAHDGGDKTFLEQTGPWKS